MAASNDDILTVEQLKMELRIPASTISQDDLLQRQIDAAISFISNEQRAPLIDESETLRLEPATGDNALSFAAVGVKSVTEIRYWTPSSSLRDAPDGTIAVADLGRVVADRRCVSVYGPSSGWPEVLSDSRFEVEFVRGIQDELIPAYRGTCITFCRHAYDGFREVRPTESFVKLSRSLRL